MFAVLWRIDGAELSGLRADLAGDRQAEEVAGDYAPTSADRASPR